MNPEHWEMEFYEDASGNEPCKNFIEALSPAKKSAIRAALVNILGRQGPNVCETEFGKPLGKGLYEFRLRHHESEILARVRPDLAKKIQEAEPGRILLRVFFHPYGDRLILLIGGYDKGDDPSEKRQQREIQAARKALKDWQDGQRRAVKGARVAGVASAHSFRTYWKKIRKSR